MLTYARKDKLHRMLRSSEVAACDLSRCLQRTHPFYRRHYVVYPTFVNWATCGRHAQLNKSHVEQERR